MPTHLTRRAALKTLALASAATLAARARVTLKAQTPSQSGSEADTPPPLTDPLRPAFHYLPARNWMNDPCGPIYVQGNYHLFHQYNPDGPLWGNMHWAHAVSPDMVRWQRLPIALAPTPDGPDGALSPQSALSPDSAGCFTGTAVLDHGRPTILYTGIRNAPRAEATLQDDHTSYRESQCLAVATDNTLTAWKKLPAPVISAPPPGMKVTGFRDPSPWHDPASNTWYAIVGAGIARQGGMVLLYRSPDLRTWEYLHPLHEGKWSGTPGTDPNANVVDTGEMWECPDFFPLTDAVTKAEKHILIHSAEKKVLWQSGVFDRSTLRFLPEKAGELDYGRAGTSRVTFYAPKTQLDAAGNRILWGWIGETRPDAECVRAGWSGLMALPRLLTLHDGELHMRPAAQVARLRNPRASATQPRHEFLATLAQTATQTPTASSAPSLLLDAAGPLVSVRSNLSQDPHTLLINNGTTPQDTVIPLLSPLSAQAGLHVFCDNSVLEIFIDNRICFTHRFYARSPATPMVTLTLAGQYKIANPRSFALTPIWSA